MVVRLLLVTAVLIAVAGCGKRESQSASAQVRSVVEQYYAALEKGDGAKACSLYTASARDEIARRLRGSGYAGCKSLLSIRLGFHLHQPLKIVSVSMLGNRAKVVLHKRNSGSTEAATLVKTHAGWRIEKSLMQVLVIR